MDIIPDYLISITEIFEKLSKGYHISNVDFNFYPELSKHEEQYQEIFSKLGYKLTSHSKGFYFFESEKVSLNASGEKMALFIFFMVDFLANKGDDPYSGIMEGEFKIKSLISDLANAYKDKMKDLGYDDPEEDFDKVIKQLANYGFASRGEYDFSFRPPIARFLDACIEIGKNKTSEDMTEV